MAPRQFGAARRLRSWATAERTDLFTSCRMWKLADLMRHRTEDCGDRLGVQRRAVGRDPLDGQPACLQGLAEAAEECLNIDWGRVAVQDVVEQPFEGAVIDDRQDTERAVIQLVGGNVPREVG